MFIIKKFMHNRKVWIFFLGPNKSPCWQKPVSNTVLDALLVAETTTTTLAYSCVELRSNMFRAPTSQPFRRNYKNKGQIRDTLSYNAVQTLIRTT